MGTGMYSRVTINIIVKDYTGLDFYYDIGVLMTEV